VFSIKRFLFDLTGERERRAIGGKPLGNLRVNAA
jgi:hypothetical protein